MNTLNKCEYAVPTGSGVWLCEACHPTQCPYPARYCRVKDRRDEAASLGKPEDTVWERLLKGFD